MKYYSDTKGGDLVLITRDLIGHRYNSPKLLDHYTKGKMLSLLEEVKKQHGYIPKFALNWYNHFVSEGVKAS